MISYMILNKIRRAGRKPSSHRLSHPIGAGRISFAASGRGTTSSYRKALLSLDLASYPQLGILAVAILLVCGESAAVRTVVSCGVFAVRRLGQQIPHPEGRFRGTQEGPLSEESLHA